MLQLDSRRQGNMRALAEREAQLDTLQVAPSHLSERGQ